MNKIFQSLKNFLNDLSFDPIAPPPPPPKRIPRSIDEILISGDMILFNMDHPDECPECGNFSVGVHATSGNICLVCGSRVKETETKPLPEGVVDMFAWKERNLNRRKKKQNHERF